jgi:NAD(P)-dependent dehydrogenase (short-subunit alcohol dehydrogenase family)
MFLIFSTLNLPDGNSKHAIEGFMSSLAAEIPAAWNISFLILELGGVNTKFAPKVQDSRPPHPAYTDPGTPTNLTKAYLETKEASQGWAEPEEAARGIWEVVKLKMEERQGKDGDRGKELPLRLPLGKDAWGLIKGDVDAFSRELDEWKEVSESISK